MPPIDQAPNPQDSQQNGQRMTPDQAGYMELSGAQKEGDCKKVAVPGGVSFKLGCCNEYEPENEQVQEFRCGMCEYRINQVPGMGNRLVQASQQPPQPKAGPAY